MDRVQETETAGGDHGLAAAAAAVADEVDRSAHILAELHQVLGPGFLQQVQPLGRVDAPGDAVAGEGGGRVVEGQADVLFGGAGPADVFHFVPAVTDADADMVGRLDDLRSPFVIQDMQGIFGAQGGFVDKDAAQLGFTVAEKLLDEVLLDVEILVEKLGQ